MPEQDRHKIEDIKRHLYDPEDSTSSRRREGVLHPINHEIPSRWADEKKPEDVTLSYAMKKPPTSIFKKFFIGAIIFFICALGFSAYTFYRQSPSVSNDKIDIAVLGNAFTKGGDELPLQVEITNRNNGALELANLVISYPRGASDEVTDMVRLPRDTIGTIAPGQTVTRNIKVTLYGDEQSTRNINISLEYHPPSSNAIFSKDKQYPVAISSAPLSLRIDAPTQATSDQEMTLTVTASLNTSLPGGTPTILQMTYPNSFVFESATPAPLFGNSVWPLSDLTTKTPVVITVKGRLVGQDGDQQVFHAYAGTASPANQSVVSVVYTSLLQTINITKPFLEAHILVDNKNLPSYTAASGDTVHAQISWVNNLSTRITNAQIIANLSGNAFDKSSVDPLEGFYDSAHSQIVWDKNSIADLASVEPGATGTLSFSFKSLSLVGSSTSISNPEIDIDVSIKGQQPTVGSTFTDINNFSKKVIKILSDFQIAASASWSTGPLPPKAESETDYIVTWTLSNSANSISGGIARAILPIYVKWVGAVAGNGENISYNSVTREVIWNIGTVKAYTGVSSNREASFTIALTPSLSQVDSVPQLTKAVFLSGTDAFSNTPVSSSYRPITTSLTNDPNFVSGNDRVIK
jgi:hypothetical protein